MTITEVKIRRLYNQERLKALVSVTFDDALVIHDIKIIQGPKRLFVAMPSRKDEKGEYKGIAVYRDIAHPIGQEMRQKLETAVFSAYDDYLKKLSESDNK